MIKKYMDIERLKEKYYSVFTVGEHIVVTEKVDGSNAQIYFDGDSICACSRRLDLSEKNTLNGFYEFSQSLSKDEVSAVLDTHYHIFGEWLVPHSVKYPTEKYRNFYVFDVWNTETEEYVPWEETKKMAEALNLKTVPVLYDGPFISWEHLMSLVGNTEMGAEPNGEGIVVKSQDRLDNKSSHTPAYIKIVHEKFSEIHDHKKEISPEKLAQLEAEREKVASIVTARRIEKLIQKMIEDNILPADWDEKDLKTISKNLPKMCFEDCRKEEPEIFNEIPNFGKLCSSQAMAHARALIK